MKIFYLSHYFPPEGNAPANRVYNLARAWVKKGHEVTVVTCVPNVPAGKVYDGYKNRRQVEDMDGIRVVRVWTYIAANKGTLLRSLNFFSYLCSAVWWCLWQKKPDLVVATSPQFFCGWAGLKVQFLKRVPFVIEIRDLWPESILAVGSKVPGVALKCMEWMERTMYRRADHVVTVGEGYRERLIEKLVPPEKISVFPNGLDVKRFAPVEVDEDFKARWNPRGQTLISYIGTIGMACGLQVVLDAAKKLKEQGREDIRFLMVGDGATRAELEKRAHDEGLDAVVFAGRQPREDMVKFLSLTDVCLVHLRKTELFSTVMPSKIFEAAAMKKPVIMGVEGYACQLVEDAGMGLMMEPDNADDLVRCVIAAAEDPAEMERMGVSGRIYMMEHYRFEKITDDYLALLVDLAE